MHMASLGITFYIYLRIFKLCFYVIWQYSARSARFLSWIKKKKIGSRLPLRRQLYKTGTLELATCIYLLNDTYVLSLYTWM